VSEGGTLTQSAPDGTDISVWGDGEIPNSSDPAKVAPGSYLTACTWFDGKSLVIRVFSQDPEGHIQQVGWNGTAWGRYPSLGI